MKSRVKTRNPHASRTVDPSRTGKRRKLIMTEQDMREATDSAFQTMITAMTAPDLNEKLEAAMPEGSSPDDYMIVYQQVLLAVAAAGIVGVIRAVGGDPSGDTKLASVCAESLKRRIEAELVE